MDIVASAEQPLGEFGFVAEDIRWFRDEWWGRRTEMLSNGHIRRATFTLGTLLLDGLVQGAWRKYGFEGEPRLPGPDLGALAGRDGLRLDLAGALVAGGGREEGSEVAFIGAFRVDNGQTGVPAEAEQGFAVKQTTILRVESLWRTTSDLDLDVERLWPLSLYLDSPAAVRRGLSITRRQLITFFRAHPGGVRRVPPDDGHPVPQSVDRGISELFGRIHADRRDGLYFELLTIGQAIGRSADLQRLASAIASVERDEARALPPTKDHDAPTRHGTFGLFVRTASDTPDPDCDIADNVIGVTLDTPIYRTIRHKYVRELMEHGSMPLAAPSLWDDPFERLICEARIHSAGDDGSSPRLLETLRRVAYGQCWSLNPESDAIWRIYSTVSKPPGSARNQTRDDEGVRLRTTIGRLLSAVSVACPSELRSRLFFGRVRYLYARDALEAVADELVRSAEGADAADSRARQTAESLLIKREPFAHEDECRLIVVDTRRGARQQQLFHVTIDEPNDIFKSITLDPRLSAEDVRERRQQLTAWGFKGEIVQSELYRPIQVDLERR